ncbi:DUF262 domain-containing protein [Deinococcus hopiensis]|uniref:Uncharacterized conserved protein n=1 Tax=Deinococcus hopiensis KR-140 TaxID=695939 RepID=A0A1W1ULS6_9DEIO|nr:DUF262 domain-containing protein [Deinococcus hopiensis]SMB81949.1 Uncharacterized conserved protein [Deinococcus hopiensis KR-140]
MRPDKRGVLELFERPQRYVIPLYQRRYVWTEEKQWEPLWGDIRHRAEAELERRGRVKPHFLGAVVLAGVRTFGRELQAFDVIDGQQRLTTFQLFLAAFRDVAKELGIHALERELERVTVNDGSLSHDLERYKVWPTRFDQPGFRRVLDHASEEAIEQEVRAAQQDFRFVPNTLAAYTYFLGELRTWLEEDPAQRGEALFTALRRYLQVVTIELEDDDDPQVIFETLNARGEPLQPADLVRNHIFSDASRRGENVHTLFEHYWAPFDEDGSLWRTDESRGRITRPQLAWFLTAFLTVKLEEDITDAVIFDAFKRWWGSLGTDTSAEAGLKELLRYARAYQRLLQSSPDTRLGVLYRRLKVMDISTLTPLLLYLLTDAGLNEAGLNTVLNDLESYVVRRFALGLGSKNYNLLFVRLLRELRRLPEETDLRTFVLAFLSRGEGDSVRWPTDQEWRSALLTLPIYKKVRPRGVAMLLEAIDLHLTTGKQEKLLIAEPLSVEHVLPQKWSLWPAPTAPEGILDTAAWRNTLLHTLGNLTLTTQKLNTALSNGPYANKRAELAKQSRLRLNTVFQTQEHWDEAVIQKRSQALAEDLLHIWHGPVGQPEEVTVAPTFELTSDAFTTIQNLRKDLDRNSIPSFWVGTSTAGEDLILYSYDWGSRSVRYHAEVVEDEAGVELLKLSLRDTFAEYAAQKPFVRVALAQLALPVQQTFGSARTQVTPTELSVWLPDGTDVATLRRALERLVSLTLPLMERAAAQTRTRSEAGAVLDAMVDALHPDLPDGFYFMAADIGAEKKWRRLANAAWPNQLHYELGMAGDKVVLHLHDELKMGSGEKSQLASIWKPLIHATREAFPALLVTGGERASGTRWINVPLDDVRDKQTLCERIQAFIHLTQPTIDAAFESRGNSAAPSLGPES